MTSGGIVLIVACLIADMATPLCPGAFRFDPAESIDAVGSRAVAALVTHVHAVSPPEHDVPNVRWSPSPRPTGIDLVRRLAIRPMLPRAALASTPFDPGSPRSAEEG
jgi:hypothetical protein